jgi:hypothetical protein
MLAPLRMTVRDFVGCGELEYIPGGTFLISIFLTSWADRSPVVLFVAIESDYRVPIHVNVTDRAIDRASYGNIARNIAQALRTEGCASRRIVHRCVSPSTPLLPPLITRCTRQSSALSTQQTRAMQTSARGVALAV